jgi:hypothetical protein
MIGTRQLYRARRIVSIGERDSFRERTAIQNPDNKKDFEGLPVISVGNDRGLLSIREAVIRSIGLSARSMTSEQAEATARSPECHVWVFCSSIELGQLVHLATTIRRCSPNSKLLLLEGAREAGPEAVLFEKIFDSPGRIETMLESVKRLATSG